MTKEQKEFIKLAKLIKLTPQCGSFRYKFNDEDYLETDNFSFLFSSKSIYLNLHVKEQTLQGILNAICEAATEHGRFLQREELKQVLGI